MRLDYRLTSMDARLDLLTQEEINALKQNVAERKNDRLVTYTQGRDLDWTCRLNALRNKFAKQAGFDSYAHDGGGNCVEDWEREGAEPDHKTRQMLVDFNLALTESPEYKKLMSESVRAKKEDAQFKIENEQEMLYEAMRISVPRMIEKGEHLKTFSNRNMVKLTANDVHSIMLTPEESREIEESYNAARQNLLHKVQTPLFKQYHKDKDALYDKLAQQAGFAQFDENEEGTGIRNYTALGKRKTPRIKEQLKEFNRLVDAGEMDESIKYGKNLLAWFDSRMNEMTQVMLRNILAKTNSRITRVDAEGKPILTAERYLETIKDMEYDERARFNAPYVTTVKTIKDGKEHNFQVDRGIATFVQQLNDAGYVTGQSCSGLLEDHPNARYVEDSKHGLFVKGDPINLNKQGCGTYLTFYEPVDWDENLILNNEKQIGNIRSVAQQQGWIVEDMHIFGMPSVRLGLPLTYDGYGTREILHEANNIVNRKHPGLEKEDFFKWLELRSAEEQRVIARHGGVVRWTDEMVKNQWNALTLALVQAEKQRQDLQRISDVRIYVGGDGHWRIKCRIDGEDMLSEHFSDAYMSLLDKGADKTELAAKCYEQQLKNMQKQENGLKR